MPPAFTGWPPSTLQPRLLLCESRPFLVEPEPFLWAASTVKGTRGAALNTGRLHTALWPRKLEASILWLCDANRTQQPHDHIHSDATRTCSGQRIGVRGCVLVPVIGHRGHVGGVPFNLTSTMSRLHTCFHLNNMYGWVQAHSSCTIYPCSVGAVRPHHSCCPQCQHAAMHARSHAIVS
jgi:hypothetical protein